MAFKRLNIRTNPNSIPELGAVLRDIQRWANTLDGGTSVSLQAATVASTELVPVDSLPFDDDVVLLHAHNKATARMRIDVGAIAHDRTRVLFMGDRDVDLELGGTFAEFGHIHEDLVKRDGSRAYTDTGPGFLDEDDLASRSAVATASQASIINFVEGAVGVSVDYFFNDTLDSGIGGIYYEMTDMVLGGGESTISTSGLATGDNQPLANFITLAGVPGIVSLRGGIYAVHVHAEKTGGTKPVTIHAEIYSRNVGGDETLLVTTHASDLITSEVEVNLHGELGESVSIAATDRLVVKWFADVGSTGSAVTVALRQEGDTISHLNLPTTSDVLSGIFIRKDGTNELTANWDAGPFSIIAKQFKSDIATGFPPFIVASTNKVTNLNADLLDGQHASAFGDFSGPGSSTDKAIVRFDGTGGKTGQNSGVTISDTDVMDGVTQLNVDSVRLDGNTINVTDTNGDLNVQGGGTGLVKVGVEGDTALGTSNPTVMHPASTGMVDLGKDSKAFGNFVMVGDAKLNLPTSNPGPGILWADGGFVKVGT